MKPSLPPGSQSPALLCSGLGRLETGGPGQPVSLRMLHSTSQAPGGRDSSVLTMGLERASDFRLVTQKPWLVLGTKVESFSQLENVQRGPFFSKIYNSIYLSHEYFECWTIRWFLFPTFEPLRIQGGSRWKAPQRTLGQPLV